MKNGGNIRDRSAEATGPRVHAAPGPRGGFTGGMAGGPTGGGMGGSGSGSGNGNGALGPLSNYSTFQATDPSTQSLLRTSDRIEESKRVLADSENVAKHVLVDLELQRSQLEDMKGMVTETSSATGQVRLLLQKIADRAYRRKLFLWTIIVALAITDIVVFYLLFVRR